ncbi:extracellular solute-binding protein [Paenibacillus cymbidii]|uniref:extracellular solute-binding protein n=1 Tax=Paenibacillus cymbidii TaxID=1639034 RepID=UPI001080A302|nr:extracellular solute-binding protein [Paenibacillus cymbidii]
MNRKQGLAAALGSVLLFVTACSSGSKDAGPSPSGSSVKPSTPAASAASAKPQAPLKISMMVTTSGDVPTDDNIILKELEKRTNTDITVTWIPTAEYTNRANVTLASGSIPDIFTYIQPSGQLMSANIEQAIKGGMFADLSPYIQDPNFAKNYPNLAAYPKDLWEFSKYKGKNYILPRNLNDVVWSGVWLRKDIFEKSGLKVPTTVDEYADVITKLANPPKLYGLSFQGKNAMDGSGMKAFANAFTGVRDWGINDKGEFVYSAFMPEYKNFLAWVKKLYDAKAIDPEFPLGQGASVFNDGKAVGANHTYQTWIQSPGRNFLDKAGPGATAMLLMPLSGPKAHALDFSPGFGYPGLVSSKFPKEDLPRLLKFWDYAASDEWFDVTTWGLENIHYKVENGKKVPIPDKVKADMVGAFGSLTWNKTRNFAQEHKDLGASQADLDNMQKVVEASQKAFKTDFKNPFLTLGLTSDTYVSKWGQLTKDLDDNRVKVVVGKMTFDEWDQFVKSVTGSADYAQIVSEFKASQAAQAQK